MIKYLGSKRTLLPLIVKTVQGLDKTETVVDLFSGTSRVGHALKNAGYRVLSNDLNTYAATLARCYVQADASLMEEAQTYLDRLQQLPPKPGYFTQQFCENSRFFKPENGAVVDAMREAIAEWELNEELEAVLLTSLMEAADRVDSTTGVQMAYLKQWAKRAHRPLALRMPNILPQAAAGKGQAHQMEAIAAAKALRADVFYLDPPYNQHKYLGNYHIWETLVRWDKPEAYGIACKRVDVRERKNPFNSKPRFRAHFESLIQAIDCRSLILSFSNEGYLSKSEMLEILSKRGNVQVIETDFKRYVGAQIGIHNPAGKKVGEVSHTRNKEFLFVVT